MHRRVRHTSKITTLLHSDNAEARMLPSLATAEQIAASLQVTSRTVHFWAQAGTIPTALRQGKIVRFHPPSVAAALGIDLPEFGIRQNASSSHPNSAPQQAQGAPSDTLTLSSSVRP